MTTEAFQEGRQAAKSGKKYTDNPYNTLDILDDEQIDKCEDWYDGYESFKAKDAPPNPRVRG